MLGTGPLALAALDAFAGLALALGDDGILPLRPELRAALAAIGHGKDIRDRNAHRTALGAIATAGTGYGLVRVQGELCLVDGPLLFLIQRLEIPHIGQVVLHLGEAAHAAEDGMNIIQSGGKAQRPAGIGDIRAGSIEDGLHFGNGIGEDPALDRLHDHDGLPVGLTDFPVAAGSDAGVFPVGATSLWSANT